MDNYPIDMPCWAPGAADYLASILKGTEDGWEWGGGASSIWLAWQVDSLTVMETDAKWAHKILIGAGEAVCQVWTKDFNDPEYLALALTAKPRPNLWLIDGYRRIDCLRLVESNAKTGDLVVCDDALDYAEHILSFRSVDVHRFDMPHPHAGEKLTSPKHKVWRNSVRTYAPNTKETWIWRA